jgi:hypothetical protein
MLLTALNTTRCHNQQHYNLNILHEPYISNVTYFHEIWYKQDILIHHNLLVF